MGRKQFVLNTDLKFTYQQLTDKEVSMLIKYSVMAGRSSLYKTLKIKDALSKPYQATT